MTETAPKSPFTTYTFSKTCSFDRAHENWRFLLLLEQRCGIEVEGDDEPVLVVIERRARVQSTRRVPGVAARLLRMPPIGGR
jgi:hypothetical protein